MVVKRIIVDAHNLGRPVRKEPLLISFTNEKLPRAYFQSLLSAEFITLGKNGLVFSECFLPFADDLRETSQHYQDYQHGIIDDAFCWRKNVIGKLKIRCRQTNQSKSVALPQQKSNIH